MSTLAMVPVRTCEADVRAVSKALKCYTDPAKMFFQSTGFLLDPEGNILLALYSSGPIGRLGPTDVMGLVNRRRNNNTLSAS